MRIGIDLDGCVYDYVDALRRHLINTAAYHPDELPDPDRWNIWECWPLSEQDFYRVSAEGIEAGTVFGTGDPYFGSLSALAQLTLARHRLHIVTARRRTTRAVSLTVEWLNSHGIPHHSLTFSSDKTLIPVDVFVEDNVDNARAIGAAGGMAILLDRPWNRHAADQLRAYDWGHVVAFIQTYGELAGAA